MRKRFLDCPGSEIVSPAEQGGISKRRAGPFRDAAGKSSFTLTTFVLSFLFSVPKVRECGSPED
jgi:hypothetical protein